MGKWFDNSAASTVILRGYIFSLFIMSGIEQYKIVHGEKSGVFI